MIVAIGDVHRKFDRLHDLIDEVTNGLENVILVQVGDFGMGFNLQKEMSWVGVLNEKLKETNSTMYVIRGNHDDPIFWTDESPILNKFENVIFVQDNTILKLDGIWCLFAGGAISIDRTIRKEGVNWWKNEYYLCDRERLIAEHNKLLYGEHITCVFTHEIYHPISKFQLHNEIVLGWADNDEYLMNDLRNNQVQMKELYDFVTFGNNEQITWVHGHYHVDEYIKSNNISTHTLAELKAKEIIR